MNTKDRVEERSKIVKTLDELVRKLSELAKDALNKTNDKEAADEFKRIACDINDAVDKLYGSKAIFRK